MPLLGELGIETSWQVLEGNQEFYQCTKNFHNALQGNRIDIPGSLINAYEKTNEQNYERLKSDLLDSDIVFIHDRHNKMGKE